MTISFFKEPFQPDICDKQKVQAEYRESGSAW